MKERNEILYTFTAKTDQRQYKFSVYADSMENAKVYADKLLNLYLFHSSRLASKLKEMQIEVTSKYAQNANDARLKEVDILLESHKNLTVTFIRELKGDEKYQEYYGRRMGSPWVGLAVFDDKESRALDEFDLESTKFDAYPNAVEDEIQKLIAVNSQEMASNISQYASEFFALHPKNEKNHDVLKLIADEKRLAEKYLKNLAYEFLAKDKYAIIDSVRAFVMAQQKLRLNSPDQHGITLLMQYVARILPVGTSIDKEFAILEKQINRILLQGADINAVDEFGRTALMYVVIGQHILGSGLTKGREHFAKLLLEHGADPTIRDVFGKTALNYYQEFIEEKDHPAITQLKQAMVNTNSQNKAEAGYLTYLFGVFSMRSNKEPDRSQSTLSTKFTQ